MWWGQVTSTTVAIPSAVASVDIGTVGPGEQMTSFASSINGTNRFAELSWMGGTYESPNIAGFYIYSGAAPGAAVSYTTPIGSVTAYPQSIYTDGFGDGGFGDGGFGEAASNYSYTAGPLAGGFWNFAVVAYDTAGNLSTPQTCTVLIVAPPLEPAADGNGVRMYYAYTASTFEATLTWNASPSA